MKKLKYVPISYASSWVSKRIDENLANKALLDDLVYEAAEHLMTYESLNPKVVFLDIKNHRVTLPDNIEYLYNIYYTDTVSQEDTYSVNKIVNSCEGCPITYEDNSYTKYIQSQWLELQPSTTNLLFTLGTDNPVSNCCEPLSYALDKENCSIVLTESTGKIMLMYLSYPVNSDNELLIPDDILVFEAIKDYCLKYIWEVRLNLHEQNSMNIYTLYHRKFLTSSTLAINKIRQLTPPELKSLASTWMFGNTNLGFKLAQR